MEPTIQNTPPIIMPPLITPPTIKYWKRRLLASIGVFLIVMGYCTYVAYDVAGHFTATVLIGSITIALGVSASFYFIYWLLSIIGRKFGKMYAVILWVLLIGLLAACYFVMVSKAVVTIPSSLQEEGIVLPPGTTLSDFPAYFKIVESKIRHLPGGGMVIPKSAITFVMTYDECLITTDVTAQQLCANKYSLEKKDVGLCKTLIRSDSLLESFSNLQEECTAQYAVVNMEPSLCLGFENEFIGGACFEGVAAQIKDPKQCRVVFKDAVDISDCEQGVVENE